MRKFECDGCNEDCTENHDTFVVKDGTCHHGGSFDEKELHLCKECQQTLLQDAAQRKFGSLE